MFSDCKEYIYGKTTERAEEKKYAKKKVKVKT